MVEYGIQMYSVRDAVKTDMKQTLKEVARLGYKYIQFAGLFDHPAADIKAWLDEYGLECVDTHTSIALLAPETIQKTIEDHKILGANRIFIPGMKQVTADDIDLQIARINYADKILKENGMTLGYHNHSREFLPNHSGLLVEEEILNRTDVEIEVDTFWLFNAGIDVIDYLEKHKDRINVIHLKDGFPVAPENRAFDTAHAGAQGKALGEGQAPVKAVREWAIKNNVLMVVESEGLDPTGLEEVGRCMKFLRSLD